MPKLLQVTTSAITVRTFLLPYAEHFRSQGWTVHAMANGIQSCAPCRAAFDETWEIAWSRNPLEVWNYRQLLRQIRDLAEREAFDLAHVHTPVAAFITRHALQNLRRKKGLKVIYTAHGFHFHEGGGRLKNALFLSLEKRAGRWTDYLVNVNQDDRTASIRRRIVPPDRVRYVPGYGLDLEAFAPARVTGEAVTAVRLELGLADDQPLLLMIAEYNPGKRHVDALRAFAGTARKDAHFAFAGIGPLMPEMKVLAAELGLAGRVHFLGFRRDIPALIRASQATVLPSEREGLPQSIQESLSLEAPVISTDIRGIRELVDASCGILVPVGDVAALTRAMDTIIEDPARASRMGRAGRDKMKHFDITRVLASYDTLYAEALRNPGGDVGRW